MQATLSELFRSIESEIGTHGFCIMVLDALKAALSQYKVGSRQKALDQLIDLFDLIRKTKPRYAILNDSLYKLLEFYDAAKTAPVGELLEEIDRLKIAYALEMKQMVQVADGIGVEGKTILIYDHSHSMQNILRHWRQDGRQFTVVVAEQDMEKTEDNIEFLHHAGIPYKVVPAYMLSHIDHTIDMVFMGAVTFQHNRHFVMDPGSKSVISHFYLEKKPVYVFLTTSKFSLWPTNEDVPEVYAKPHRRQHHSMADIEFERLKFSHDRVSADLITATVTEIGIHSSAELIEILDQRFAKRKKQQNKFFKKSPLR